MNPIYYVGIIALVIISVSLFVFLRSQRSQKRVVANPEIFDNNPVFLFKNREDEFENFLVEPKKKTDEPKKSVINQGYWPEPKQKPEQKKVKKEVNTVSFENFFSRLIRLGNEIVLIKSRHREFRNELKTLRLVSRKLLTIYDLGINTPDEVIAKLNQLRFKIGNHLFDLRVKPIIVHLLMIKLV